MNSQRADGNPVDGSRLSMINYTFIKSIHILKMSSCERNDDEKGNKPHSAEIYHHSTPQANVIHSQRMTHLKG